MTSAEQLADAILLSADDGGVSDTSIVVPKISKGSESSMRRRVRLILADIMPEGVGYILEFKRHESHGDRLSTVSIITYNIEGEEE